MVVCHIVQTYDKANFRILTETRQLLAARVSSRALRSAQKLTM